MTTQTTHKNQNRHPTDIVQFTPLQLEYLEALFPQIVFNANHSEGQMRHYFGSQAVIHAIRNKTNGLAKRNEVISKDNIPTP